MNRKQVINNLVENMGNTMRLMHKTQAKPKTGTPTRAQLGILIMIGHWGIKNTKDLAVKLEMTSSAVTQVVDALAKDGLLKRQQDQKDRRITVLELTSVGKKKLEIAKKQRLEFLFKLLSPLNDNDLMHLKKIQDKIIQSLHAHVKA